MAIKIEFSGSELKGAKILNRAKVVSSSDDVVFRVKDSKIYDELMVMDEIEILKAEQDIKAKMLKMDPNTVEYCELKEIFGRRDRALRRIGLRQHIQSFAEGVAASVIASYIVR